MDVSDTAFDACGKKAIADVRAANKNGMLIGSLAHGYVQPANIQEAYFIVVMKVFHGEIGPEAAAGALAASIAAVR